MADAKTIPLDSIRIDGATQPRCMIDEAAVAEYAEDMRDGFPFPPVTVFHDGAVNWLADGFHRYHGARRAGLESILARVESGTVTDARWFACGANRAHGLRRSPADKRRAVEMALKDHPEKSDRAIAEHVGVDHKTVASVRVQVGNSPRDRNLAPRTGADGKQYPLPPPRPISPVPPPLPPPAEAPQITDAEHAILEREPEEIHAAVLEYMAAHPAVSACQALSLVKRKGVPGEDPRLTRLRAAGEDEQRKIDEEKRAGTVEYGPPPVEEDAAGKFPAMADGTRANERGIYPGDASCVETMSIGTDGVIVVRIKAAPLKHGEWVYGYSLAAPGVDHSAPMDYDYSLENRAHAYRAAARTALRVMEGIDGKDAEVVKRWLQGLVEKEPSLLAARDLAKMAAPLPAAAAVVLDAVGQEVPPELHALWARRQEAQDLLTSLSRIRGAVRRCEDEKDPLGATVNYNSLHAHLDQAYADLECLKPYAVCTSCHGLIGCRLCGGSGLLSKFRWDTCVPRETKDRIASEAGGR